MPARGPPGAAGGPPVVTCATDALVEDGVEARVGGAAESFFLSPTWADACLATWPQRASFERIDLGPFGADRCFVLVGRAVETRHGFLRVRVAALNESLDAGLDEVTIEQNGIYGCRDDRFDTRFDELLERLGSDRSWDELRFSGLLGQRALLVERIAARHGLRVRVFKERPTYWVDLALARRSVGGYLGTVSSNLRQQLRRARRQLEASMGAVALATPRSAAEAIAWLDDMAPLHRSRWSSTPSGSGFDHPAFVEFHRRLIGAGFQRGAIELLRLEAGGNALAYLYNLRHGGRVSFYLSAIDYQSAHAFKPGLLVHWMAIERALSNGDDVYDFLAGESHYKARLSSHRDVQLDLVLWRPRPVLRVEHALRRVRRRMRAVGAHVRAGGEARYEPE